MNYSDAARRSAGSACRLTACSIACLGATLIGTSAVAQEEDVVIFNNGDRLTGEIRGLSRAQLSFNTDATGTIGVGRAIRRTPGAFWVLCRAAASVLYNVPYCLRRRRPVTAEDFELPLG